MTIFISRHTSLATLEIDLSSDELNISNFLQVIVNSCKELEELQLGIKGANTSTLLPLKEIKSLKTLKLWSMSCDDFRFIPALSELRKMHLNHCDLPKDSKTLCIPLQITFNNGNSSDQSSPQIYMSKKGGGNVFFLMELD